MESTAERFGESRIVMVSSEGYKLAAKLDYNALTTVVPDSGTRWWHAFAGFRRYSTTKLANVYFAFELDRRLRQRDVKNVYCNVCHPGVYARYAF